MPAATRVKMSGTEKKVNGTTYNISSIKRVTRKFLHGSFTLSSFETTAKKCTKKVCCPYIVVLLVVFLSFHCFGTKRRTWPHMKTLFMTIAGWHHFTTAYTRILQLVLCFFFGKLGLLFSNPSEIDNSGSCRQMSSSWKWHIPMKILLWWSSEF